jgi:hypothetical protein
MTLFARNGVDDYDKHMHANHYPLMKAGLGTLCGEGHVKGPKIVDLGGGSGVLLAHMMLGSLSGQILDFKREEPVQLINVDATEVMLVECFSRMLRRLAKMVVRGATEENKLFVYGGTAQDPYHERYSQDYLEKQDHQGHRMETISLLTPDSEGRIRTDGRTLRELLRIEMIQKDVATLDQDEIAHLKDATTVLVSYCFHWFTHKPESARLIRDLLSDEGRFISIEEWPLRVSIPEGVSDEERKFYRRLIRAIKNATTPIEIYLLYKLFVHEGLERVGIGEVDGETRWLIKQLIDLYHNMYFTVWKRSGSLLVPDK